MMRYFMEATILLTEDTRLSNREHDRWELRPIRRLIAA
jgi:hypothetical protein